MRYNKDCKITAEAPGRKLGKGLSLRPGLVFSPAGKEIQKYYNRKSAIPGY